MIDERNLLKIMPKCPAPAAWAAALNGSWEKRLAPVSSSPLLVAHWLAQIAHESSELRRLEENLSYSAERLCQVWPARFRTVEEAKPYARNPVALADRVYAGRLGNGGPPSGDGYRYRGRGPIQLTGRANYAAAGRDLGLDLVGDPDVVAADPVVGALVAAWFFQGRAVIAALQDDLRDVTRIVNGGMTGIEERARYLDRAKQALVAAG